MAPNQLFDSLAHGRLTEKSELSGMNSSITIQLKKYHYQKR